VWLYEKKSEEFSQKGRELIDRQALLTKDRNIHTHYPKALW
jgi:hypothetical protein